MRERRPVNTTLDSSLYLKAQQLALQLSSERGSKIHVNDLLEEALEYILTKYQTEQTRNSRP